LITTTVYVDLSQDRRESNRRAAFGSLYGLPSGSRVVVFVGSQQLPDPAVCWVLSDFVADVHLDITGDPTAVENWSASIREGRP